VKKLEHSIELLQKAERLALQYDPSEGYYCAFSAGKDSQCLYHVAKLAGVKFKAHMSLTSVDPPEVIRFLKEHYPDVERVKPKRSIFQSAIEREILPTMRVRWCCKEFKESAGAGKVTLIGIRHEESPRRAKRKEVEIDSRKFSGTLEELDEYRAAKNEKMSKPHRGRPSKAEQITIVNADGERTLGCINGKESLLISPIIDWTEKDVWTFLNTLGIAHCSLYDEGWKRIGCILCPMSQPRQKKLEEKRWPHVKRNWIKAIKAIRGGRNVQKRVYLVEHSEQSHSERECRAQTSQGRQSEGSTQSINGLLAGFSDSSSSGRLTDEQENEIAENIYDWWISQKSYEKWYAEKFLQKDMFADKEEGQ
jgi:phosphoadenosine phosphosulfate reductase